MSDGLSPARVLFAVPTLGLRMDLLRDSLDSIRAQDVPGVDLVLVAPDRSDLQALAAEYDARLVPDPSRGLSGALNAGLAAARPGTEFFAWLGDDDLLTPGSLQLAVDALERHPDASMVYGWCDYMAPDGTVVFSSRAGKWAARLIGWGPNLVPQPGSVQRLEMTRAVGGLDESLKFGMDLDLFLKLRRLGPLINVDATLAHFRWHPDSNTVSNQDRSSSESEEIRLRYLGPTARAARPAVRGPVMWSLAQARAHVTRRSRRVSGAPHA
jgi:glycosyltransferase involved in cell wall biosynthesis